MADSKTASSSSSSGLLAKLEEWLQSPVGTTAPRDPNGFVSICDTISMCAELRDLSDGSAAAIVDVVRSADEAFHGAGASGGTPPAAVAMDGAGRGVRLRGLAERVRLAVERHVQASASGAVSLLDLLRTKALDILLSSVTETSEQLATLRDAMSFSEIAEVAGSRVVLRQPLWLPDPNAFWWSPDGFLCGSAQWPIAAPADGATADGAAEGASGTDGKSGADGAADGTGADAGEAAGPGGAGTVYVPFFADVGGAAMGPAACWWDQGSASWPPHAGHYAGGQPYGGAYRFGAYRGGPGGQGRFRERAAASVAHILEHPPQEVVDCMEPDGSVPVSSIFAAKPGFATRMYNNPSLVVQAIQANSTTTVTADAEKLTVRLLSPEELLMRACENYITGKVKNDSLGFGVAPDSSNSQPVPVEELLALPPVASLLTGMVAASSGEGAPDEKARASCLQQTLEGSDVLQVVEAGVAMRSPDRLVREITEKLLDTDYRAKGLIQDEGEISLHFITEQIVVRKVLKRVAVRGGKAAMDAVRAAMQTSEKFAISDSGMSIQLRGAPGGSRKGDEASVKRSSGGGMEVKFNFAGEQVTRTSGGRSKSPPRRHFLPTERDALALRKLLSFYFEPFNLQHNRVLMAFIEAKRRSSSRLPSRGGYLRSNGLRPVFRLHEICALPRVGKVTDRYDDEVLPGLFAAALQTGEKLPVRIRAEREVGAPRGAWNSADPVVELTYPASLRFVESNDPSRPEVLALVSKGPSSDHPLHGLPDNAVCVVSYSVSSDLSHSQSPKAQTVLEAIADGGLDPMMTTWEYRQHRIVRQLLLHGPDIICFQGLQSIGFAERCSESEPAWFSCEDEPASNHLVHVYREMAKANYGVAFAPTMKLPGSAVVCFGNAVFWKRSRWQLNSRRSVGSAAVVVELASRTGGCPPIAVCSSKSAAVYVRDWAEAATDEEVVGSIQDVQTALAEIADEGGAKPIWCGDFGCDSDTVIDRLTAGSETLTTWKSAYTSVMGEEPRATVLKSDGRNLSTDFVFHNDDLEALAVLGSLREDPSLVEFLRAGHPSDHILQMVLFVGRSTSGDDDSSGDEQHPTWASRAAAAAAPPPGFAGRAGCEGDHSEEGNSGDAPPGL